MANITVDEIILARHRLYELYQLDWMSRHGYSLEHFAKYAMEHAADGEFSISDWERDVGFAGECFVCYEEFLNSEYMDKDYMRTLAERDESRGRSLYLAYLEEQHSRRPDIPLNA